MPLDQDENSPSLILGRICVALYYQWALSHIDCIAANGLAANNEHLSGFHGKEDRKSKKIYKKEYTGEKNCTIFTKFDNKLYEYEQTL